jgi:hypothetical protein
MENCDPFSALHGLKGTDLADSLHVTRIDLLQTKTVEEYEHLYLLKEKLNGMIVVLGDKPSNYHFCMARHDTVSSCREKLSKDVATRLFVTINDDFDHADEEAETMMALLLHIGSHFSDQQSSPWELSGRLPRLPDIFLRRRFEEHRSVLG